MEYHNFKIKRVDFSEGDENNYKLSGLLSSSAQDSYGDIVEPSAFLDAGVNEMVLLFSHDNKCPIGLINSIEVVGDEVRFSSIMPKEDSFVRDRIAPQIRIGALKGMSVGFRAKEWENLPNGGRRFTKIEPMEGSVVIFAANPNAKITSLKSLNGGVKDMGEVLETLEESSVELSSSSAEEKKELDEYKSMLSELRSSSSEDKEKINKMQAALDEKTQKLSELRKDQEEIRKKQKSLEQMLARGPVVEQKPVSYKSVASDFIVNMTKTKMNDDFVKKYNPTFEKMNETTYRSYISTATGKDGGYLVPEVWSSRLISSIIETSNISREVNNVMMMGAGDFYRQPKLDASNVSVSYLPSGGTINTSTFEVESTNIQIFTGYVAFGATLNIIDDSAYDVVGEIETIMPRIFAADTDKRILLGAPGTEGPKGILSSAGVEEIETAASGAMDGDDISNLIMSLPDVIRSSGSPIFVMPPSVLHVIRTLKDNNGAYRFWSDLSRATPDVLSGYRIVTSTHMGIETSPITAGNKVMIFGDFSTGYTFVRKRDMVLISDVNIDNLVKKFVFVARHGGDVVQSEAFKVLKIKA